MRGFVVSLGVTLGILALVAGPPAWSQAKVDPLTGKVTGVVEHEDEEPAADAAGGADLTAANKRVAKGDYAGAEKILQELRGDFPDDPRLLLMLGEVLVAQNRPAEAREPLERAAELKPDLPRVQFQLGTVLAGAGEQDAALAAFGAELENNDDPQVLVLAHLNRAVLFQQARQYAEAAEEFEAVGPLDPAKQEAWGEAARCWIQAGDLDRAEAALERGRVAGFESAQHWYSLGAQMYREGRHEDAVGAFEQAIDIDPKLARAERSLGAALEKLGRNDEAVAHFRRYLDLAPDASDADRVKAQIEAAGG